MSVYATAANVFVGGVKLSSYQPDGTPTPGFMPPAAVIDPSLRTDVTRPAFRDIVGSGSTLVAACECDSINDASGAHATKALVQIDAATGACSRGSPPALSPTARHGAWP